MKIFFEGIPIDVLPERTRRPGEFFSRLVGVRVSRDGNFLHVEPMYIPLVRFQRRAGQVFIEINNYSRPLAYITLQGRRPFISVFRFLWELDDAG